MHHGRRRFRVDYADQWGVPRREWVLGEQEAIDLYTLRKAEVRQETFDPVSLGRHRRQGRREGVKLSVVIDEVLAESKASLRSWKEDERHAEYMREEFGSRLLEDVLPEDLRRWRRRRLEDDKVKPATINRTMAFLRKVYYHAIYNGYTTDNVVTKLGGRKGKSSAMLPEENERDVYLSETEEDVLREKFVLAEWHKVELAIHTGLREANLFGLRRSWVDFRTHTIRIPAGAFKKRRRHVVNMNEWAEQILKEILESHESEWVFPSRRGDRPQPSGAWLKKYFEPARDAAGLGHVRWHDLRATCATRMLEAGASLEDVRDQLGHSSLRMVQRYARVVEQHQRMALERMAETSRRRAAARNDQNRDRKVVPFSIQLQQ